MMDDITLVHNGREYTISPTELPPNAGDDDPDTIDLAWSITRSDGKAMGNIGYSGNTVPDDEQVRALAAHRIDQA